MKQLVEVRNDDVEPLLLVLEPWATEWFIPAKTSARALLEAPTDFKIVTAYSSGRIALEVHGEGQFDVEVWIGGIRQPC